jgi:magnesium transporter
MGEETGRVRGLRSAIANHDEARVTEVLADIEQRHQLTSALNTIPDADIDALMHLIGSRSTGELLSHLDPRDAAGVLARIDSSAAATIVAAMNPDEATDIVGALQPDTANRILAAMQADDAEEISALLVHSPDTAGGRMTPAFVSISPNLRADEAIFTLRRLAEEAETINDVYVTDDAGHLLGVLSLRRLVLSQPNTPVRELMATRVRSVNVLDDQEVAARVLVEQGLLAVPVVDAEQRLIGIITVDDVSDILEDEATEDIERLGGSGALETPYLRAQPILLWRRRIVWLLVLFIAEGFTGTVMRFFEEDLAAAVALSFFIPLLIGTGGNVGSQVVMTIVRAMAVGDVHIRDTLTIVRKEGQTGLMLGATMAVVAFLRALILDVGTDIAFVVAVSVAAIVVWATLVAAVLPLVLRQLRVDPTVVSAPFIATLVDGTGLVIYFSVARLIL